MNKRFLFYLGIFLACSIYLSCKNSHATIGNKEVKLAELIKEAYSAERSNITISSADNINYETKTDEITKIDTVFVQGEFLILKRMEFTTYYPLKNLKDILLEKGENYQELYISFY